jgi:hypothetical protein
LGTGQAKNEESPAVHGLNLITDEVCPFCKFNLQGRNTIAVRQQGDYVAVQCPVCGPYNITGTAVDLIANWTLSDDRRMAMAFALRRMTDRPNILRITSDVLRALRDTAALPAPEALLDEAVLWFGGHSTSAGHPFQVTYEDYRTTLGAINPAAFDFITDWMLGSGLFRGIKPHANSVGSIPIGNCQLTPAGWKRYTELSESRAVSRYGFMAMKYDDPELDALLADHFAPEVRKTGFDLRRLDQNQPAGLIDDQLRVRIRTSRFLVCDLTHGNRGAYWESGFAEGLGRPVIDTCRKDVFEDRKHEHHPHFDTNHMVTVIWDPGDLAKAASRLKDTVRATLPSEAQLND